MNAPSSGAVVVTGATGGIGFATARALRARGFTVVGSHLPDEDASPLRALGAEAFALDLRRLDDVRAFAVRVRDALGAIPLGLVPPPASHRQPARKRCSAGSSSASGRRYSRTRVRCHHAASPSPGRVNA
jgi:nucleoside-diphosphate-sugar epimerase